MPNAPELVVVIGPEELTATLPPTDAAAMPMPFPLSVVMLPGLNNDMEIGASAGPVVGLVGIEGGVVSG
jgi:hypothetical protein